MKIIATAAVGLALVCTLSTAPALAQNARTFVSAQSGVDTNPCTRPSPCRTFAHALTQTNAGGEINTLDPGGYGTVLITKSISIVSGLGEAGVLVPSLGTGITITAGVNDIINLRGLIIEGAGVGQTGILFNTGASLTIEKCVVRNLTTAGIKFAPNATSNLAVSDTLVAAVPDIAIHVAPSGGSGAVTAVFNRVEADWNEGGFLVEGQASTGTVSVTVTDSVAAFNASGFSVSTDTGKAPTSLMVIRSVAANNGTGIEAIGTGATLWIGASAVTGNSFGWQAFSGGVVQSYGTNQINGNANAQSQAPAIAGGSN